MDFKEVSYNVLNIIYWKSLSKNTSLKSVCVSVYERKRSGAGGERGKGRKEGGREAGKERGGGGEKWSPLASKIPSNSDFVTPYIVQHPRQSW